MNSIIQKCVAELKLEKPRIEYVLGLLEGLAEMQSPVAIPSFQNPTYTITAGTGAGLAGVGSATQAADEMTEAERAYLHGGTGTVTG